MSLASLTSFARIHTFAFHCGNQIPFTICLAEQLRKNLDGLASGKKVIEWYTRHTSHFDVVHEAHELVEQPLREVCVLEAVHGEPSAGLVRAVLELSDDGVVHVLFLLAEKVGANGVDGVAAELVLTSHVLQQVELDPAFHVRLFQIALAEHFNEKCVSL